MYGTTVLYTAVTARSDRNGPNSILSKGTFNQVQRSSAGNTGWPKK